MVQIEEMTEPNPSLPGIDRTIGEGTMTERNSSLTGIVRTEGEGTRRDGEPFRAGYGIVIALARLGEEVMGDLSSRQWTRPNLSATTTNIGYN